MNLTRRRLLWLIGLFPMLFFGFVTWRYSVNTPWFDDFDSFPNFLQGWILSNSFSEKLHLLFQPNNEHRMVFGKALTAAYYAITGQLNFVFLQLAGTCFTFGTLLLLWKAFRSTELPAYLFLPVPYLLFQLQYYLIFLWSICSLQHQPVVFFVCLSMLLLARQESGWGRFGWAVLAGFCANFAMSNGIFVWVGGAAILFFQTRYRMLAVWCASGVIAIVFYFSGMSTQGNESSVHFFLQNPHLSFLGFFAFLGGLFDFAPDRAIQVRTALPIVTAMLVMGWVILWLLNLLLPWLRNTFRKSATLPAWMTRYQLRPGFELMGYFSLGVMLFLLSNAAVIGLLRPRFGFFVMLVSNYKIYPALFLIISYLSFLSSTDVVLRVRAFRGVIALSAMIWLLSLVHYGPIVSERRKFLLVNAYNQQHHAFGLGHHAGSPAAMYVDSLMQFMTQRNIYHYPTEYQPLFEEMKGVKKPLGEKLFHLELKPKELYFTSPFAKVPNGYDTGAFAFLRKDKELYIIKLNQRLYPGRNILIRYDEGLDGHIPYEAVPAGTYEWGILIRSPSGIESGLGGKITLP